jgi:DNA topoisomerase I
MTIGIGKFGPYVRHDSKYVSLAKEDDPYTITEERAVELILQKRAESASDTIGEYEGKPISTGKGRFGPYVKFEDKYISLPKGEQLGQVSLERAIELIEQKRQAEANKYIKEFPENPNVKIVNGMYGPYLAVGKRNVRIPKDTDAASLTLEQCLALAGEPSGGTAEKKAPAKKTSAKATIAKKAAPTKKK